MKLCCIEVLKMCLDYVGGALGSNDFCDLEVEKIIGISERFTDEIKNKIKSRLEQLALVRGVYASAEMAFVRAACLARARESVV